MVSQVVKQAKSIVARARARAAGRGIVIPGGGKGSTGVRASKELTSRIEQRAKALGASVSLSEEEISKLDFSKELTPQIDKLFKERARIAEATFKRQQAEFERAEQSTARARIGKEFEKSQFEEARRSLIVGTRGEQFITTPSKIGEPRIVVEPTTAAQVRGRVAKVGGVTETRPVEIVGPLAKPSPEILEADKSGIRALLATKGKQTPSQLEAKPIETKAGLPLKEIAKPTIEFIKSIPSGVAQIGRFGLGVGEEARFMLEPVKITPLGRAKQTKKFLERKEIFGKEIKGKAIELIKDPNVLAVGTLGAFMALPAKVATPIFGGLVVRQVEKFGREPTQERFGELLLSGAFVAARPVIKAISKVKVFEPRPKPLEAEFSIVGKKPEKVDPFAKLIFETLTEQYPIFGVKGAKRRPSKVELRKRQKRQSSQQIRDLILTKDMPTDMGAVTARQIRLGKIRTDIELVRPFIQIEEKGAKPIKKKVIDIVPVEGFISKKLETFPFPLVDRKGKSIFKIESGKGVSIRKREIQEIIPTIEKREGFISFQRTQFKPVEQRITDIVKKFPDITKEKGLALEERFITRKESKRIIQQFIGGKEVGQPRVAGLVKAAKRQLIKEQAATRTKQEAFAKRFGEMSLLEQGIQRQVLKDITRIKPSESFIGTRKPITKDSILFPKQPSKDLRSKGEQFLIEQKQISKIKFESQFIRTKEQKISSLEKERQRNIRLSLKLEKIKQRQEKRQIPLLRKGEILPKGKELLGDRPRGGFRQGMREKLFGRLQQRQRRFILIEPVEEFPTVNLPVILGVKGITRVAQAGALTKGFKQSELRAGAFRIGTREGQRLATDMRLGLDTRLTQRAEFKPFSLVAQREKVRQISLIAPITAVDLMSGLKQEQAQLQQQAQDRVQGQMLEQDLITIFDPPPPPPPTPRRPPPGRPPDRFPQPDVPPPDVPPPEFTPDGPPPPPPPPPPPRIIIDPDKEPKTFQRFITGRKEQGYEVMIKKPLAKKGKKRISRGFTRASTRPLTKNQAINLGARITDTFVNRSFSIRKTPKAARPSLEAVDKAILSKFRFAKKNPRVFVEKTTFAIDSPQEKAGIPFKAARLRRAGAFKKERRINFL